MQLCDSASSFDYTHANDVDYGKYEPQFLDLQFDAHEKQDSTERQLVQFSVRLQVGAIVSLQCSGSLTISDVISILLPGISVLVQHGARLLHNDDRIHTLDSGCCLEIHEWLYGGGSGCSRVRPVDDVSVSENVDASANAANAQGSDRTTVQHASGTESESEQQASQLSRIVDEQKIALDNLQREKREEAAASAKELTGLRLRVVELETLLSKGQAVNETPSDASLGQVAEGQFHYSLSRLYLHDTYDTLLSIFMILSRDDFMQHKVLLLLCARLQTILMVLYFLQELIKNHSSRKRAQQENYWSRHP